MPLEHAIKVDLTMEIDQQSRTRDVISASSYEQSWKLENIFIFSEHDLKTECSCA